MKAPPDSVRSYLTEIGRVPLPSPEQEIILGRKIQKLKSLLSSQEKSSTPKRVRAGYARSA